MELLLLVAFLVAAPALVSSALLLALAGWPRLARSLVVAGALVLGTPLAWLFVDEPDSGEAAIGNFFAMCALVVLLVGWGLGAAAGGTLVERQRQRHAARAA